jgi:hypothetical protein
MSLELDGFSFEALFKSLRNNNYIYIMRLNAVYGL